jgi:hypothetical protein
MIERKKPSESYSSSWRQRQDFLPNVLGVFILYGEKERPLSELTLNYVLYPFVHCLKYKFAHVTLRFFLCQRTGSLKKRDPTFCHIWLTWPLFLQKKSLSPFIGCQKNSIVSIKPASLPTLHGAYRHIMGGRQWDGFLCYVGVSKRWLLTSLIRHSPLNSSGTTFWMTK